MSTRALLRFSSVARPEDVHVLYQEHDGYPEDVVPRLQRAVAACKRGDPAALSKRYIALAERDGRVRVFPIPEDPGLDTDHEYDLVAGKDPRSASWRDQVELTIDDGDYRGPLAAWEQPAAQPAPAEVAIPTRKRVAAKRTLSRRRS